MAINILIVDDSAVMRSMIAKTIRMSGVTVGALHQAGNGREGLAVLENEWVDLVFLDINMPVMSGAEMIECMAAAPELRDIPVVVVSTEGSRERIGQLEARGVRFIHKPFTPEIVSETVKDILRLEAFDANPA